MNENTNNKVNINTNQVNKENRPMADVEEILGIMLPADCNLSLPDPVLLNTYRLNANRIIEIRKDIDESLFNEIQQIILWNMEDEKNNVPVEDRKPIKILMHSYGGDISSCFAFLDIMKMSKTPIWTFGMQSMMSAGAMIFINGHVRYTMPMSVLLLHSGAGQVSGSYTEVQQHNENYKKMVDMMKKNTEEHSKMSKQKLAQVFNKESFFYVKDQIQYGLADYIWDDMSILFK